MTIDPRAIWMIPCAGSKTKGEHNPYGLRCVDENGALDRQWYTRKAGQVPDEYRRVMFHMPAGWLGNTMAGARLGADWLRDNTDFINDPNDAGGDGAVRLLRKCDTSVGVYYSPWRSPEENTAEVDAEPRVKDPFLFELYELAEMGIDFVCYDNGSDQHVRDRIDWLRRQAASRPALSHLRILTEAWGHPRNGGVPSWDVLATDQFLERQFDGWAKDIKPADGQEIHALIRSGRPQITDAQINTLRANGVIVGGIA